ncbi:MAG: hypothetical protein JXA66_00110, partial [Oligoflexia bacterium]|nr:hypothetical protein [Oligoflexia bacterium]
MKKLIIFCTLLSGLMFPDLVFCQRKGLTLQPGLKSVKGSWYLLPAARVELAPLRIKADEFSAEVRDKLSADPAFALSFGAEGVLAGKPSRSGRAAILIVPFKGDFE